MREGEYHFDDTDPVPFRVIHIDHLGPFLRSSKGNEHVLVIADSFTKFIIIRPVKSTAARHVIDILNAVTSYVGVPERLKEEVHLLIKNLRNIATPMMLNTI